MPALLLPLLALNALCCLPAGAFLLAAGRVPAPLAAHLAFAAAVLPLILAAIAYFVPVLTRSGPPPRHLALAPLAALAAGWLAVAAFAGALPYATLDLAIVLAMAAMALLAGWIVRRRRHMVGQPHPGLAWYLAALGFLLAALAAALALRVWPQHHAAWRLFHLHANLLGFVGLTAIGTLQVLLPTCLGRPDPRAMPRLHRDLPWAAGGVGLVALGAASWAPLALAGGLLLAGVLLRLLGDSLRGYGRALWPWHGAAAALVAAVCGLLALLLLGLAHGAGLLPARPAILGFVVAFLLPLVSGAVSQLLPVWLRPGPQTPWHAALRARLTRWSGARGLVLLALGLWLTLRH